MFIYNYLFYKSYQIGQRSGNFEGMPVLAGVIWVSFCAMLNLFTLYFLLEGLLGVNQNLFKREYKYIFALIWVLLLIFYYSYKERYKRIIAHYQDKERSKGKSLHPIIVIFLYYGLSFVLGTLAAMYRNGDGIFK
jgi:high-affinity Fe2+/Pb2+ permease